MQELERVKEFLVEIKIFLVVDEAEVRGESMMMAWLESLKNLKKPILLPASNRVTTPVILICTIVNHCFKKINIARGKFLLLLSDATSYMLKASKRFKFMYPLLLRLT